MLHSLNEKINNKYEWCLIITKNTLKPGYFSIFCRNLLKTLPFSSFRYSILEPNSCNCTGDGSNCRTWQGYKWGVDKTLQGRTWDNMGIYGRTWGVYREWHEMYKVNMVKRETLWTTDKTGNEESYRHLFSRAVM